MGKKATPETGGKWIEEGVLLGQLIDERYDSRAEFARVAGVTPYKVSNWCRGITRLKGQERTRVAHLLNLPEDALRRIPSINVALNLASDQQIRSLGKDVITTRVGVRHVPIYGALAAGAMAYSYSDVVDFEEMPEWGGDFERWGRIVSGDSMNDEFQDGDIVIFENRRHEDGHAVHAFAEGEDAFKIYRRLPEGERLMPMNPIYAPLELKGYEVRGIVIAKVRYGRNFRQVTEYKGGFRFYDRS